MGEPGSTAFAEIATVAHRISTGVVAGDYRGAVASFVDYWNGPGAWSAMRPTVQNGLIRWAPKGPLNFRALIEEPTPAGAYRALTFPVLILRGEHAPMPTRVIAEGLPELLPNSRLIVVSGAAHMGPLTNALEVSRLIAQHINAANLEKSLAPAQLPQRVQALDAELDVNFQEVVHSVLTRNADVAKPQ